MLFMQTAQAAYKYSDNQFYRSSGIKTATYVALKLLVFQGGKMTHTELANRTNTERHNVTGLVERMKKDGLVTTRRDKQDRRLIKISITDKGRALLRETNTVARKIIEQLVRDISQDQVRDAEKILQIFRRNIDQNSGI